MAETKAKKKQGGGKSSSAKPKNKKPTKKELEQMRMEEEIRAAEKKAQNKQAAAIVLFFASVLLFVISVFAGGEGSIYNKFHAFHMGVWGVSAYVYPIVTIIFAYFLSLDRQEDKPWFPYFWACLLVAASVAMIHIIRCDTFATMDFGEQIAFEYKNLDTMGGVLGALLGGFLYLLCKSKAVSLIFCVIFLFIIAIILSRTTVKKIVNAIGTPVKKVSEATGEAVQRWREASIADSVGDDESDEDEKQKLIEKNRREFAARSGLSRREKRAAKAKPTSAENNAESAAVTPVDDDFIDFTAIEGEKRQPLRKAVRHNFVVPPENGFPEKTAEKEAPAEKPEEQDSFESMFATVDAMEKAYNDDMLQNSAGEPASENEKIKLSEDEFNDAKDEVASEIADNDAAVPVKEYKLPPMECLNAPVGSRFTADREELKANADKLIAALNSFKVEAKVVDIVPGPSVTRYELQPAAGVKISKFTNLADDLALHLAAPAGVRIEAPIPNKSAIGIEIPNRDRASVFIRELIDCDEYRSSKSKLNVALGKDITGSGVYLDIAKMPHLLVAGTTGSGKSVCLNSMIISILFNAKPSEVKLLLIDPKTVEFSIYNDIPHLLVPVVNEPRKAAGALGWAVTEMINRYKILNDNGTRDVSAYNALCDERDDLEKLPQIVIVIDELSDLMSVAPSEVEDSITRLAQMARAAGMHLVVATQRPSVDVITGLIKANIPSRIALSVSSQIDSRTILDASGAEKLLGNGDMLVAPVGRRKPVRVQGCYVSDAEIKRVVDFVKTQEFGQYDEEIQKEIERQAVAEKKKGSDKGGSSVGALDGNDELIMRAVDFIVNNPDCCSISALQRKLGMGFSKAGRVMDTLEEQGIVGHQEGSKGRKVLLSKAEWEQMKALSSSDSDE